MKAVKCDICKQYVNVWREVNFEYWVDNFTGIEVKDICLNCVDEIEEKIKEMALKY